MKKYVLLCVFAALVIVFLCQLAGVAAYSIAATHARRPTRAAPRDRHGKPFAGPGIKALP